MLTGGKRAGGALAKGFYLEPTIIEGAEPGDDLSVRELFGPIAALYRVTGFRRGVEARERFALRPHGLHPYALDRSGVEFRASRARPASPW